MQFLIAFVKHFKKAKNLIQIENLVQTVQTFMRKYRQL